MTNGQKKYRTFTLKSSKDGFKMSYKETHEGLMVLLDDGTWGYSIAMPSLDFLIAQAAIEVDEGWEVELT